MFQAINNLNEVDFLPERYWERGLQRRAYFLRGLMAIAFVGFFVVSACHHLSQHRQVQAGLTEVAAQLSLATAHNARLAQDEQNLARHRGYAELLTYMRRHWPRTQILAAVVEPLPESMTLVDWKISREALPQAHPTQPPPPPAAPDKAPPADRASRQARDLQKLLQESAGHQYYVDLIGHATEAAELHEYLARLGANPLFSKIDLRSIEHKPHDPRQAQPTGSQHFTVRAILAPSYCQNLPAKAPTPNPPGTPVALRGERP